MRTLCTASESCSFNLSIKTSNSRFHSEDPYLTSFFQGFVINMKLSSSFHCQINVSLWITFLSCASLQPDTQLDKSRLYRWSPNLFSDSTFMVYWLMLQPLKPACRVNISTFTAELIMFTGCCTNLCGLCAVGAFLMQLSEQAAKKSE